jgi:hypothetical protein
MYKLKFHPTLAGRWSQFTQTQQVLMIANELNRAINAIEEKHYENVKMALARALELTDLMIESSEGTRRYELLRLRSLFAEVYVSPQQFQDVYLKRLCKVLLSFDSEAFNSIGHRY